MAVRRIGLLGGSFNLAHEGHLHISHLALVRLRLTQVWWVVSPQNPLKGEADMAPMDDRLAAARTFVGDPRIRVSDIERRMGTVYTLDTVTALQARFRSARFVWLMGADNLIQVSRWRHWESLFNRVPIAVFPRPSYSFRALASPAAVRFADFRVKDTRAGLLADLVPPAWVFLRARAHRASATRIRERRQLRSDGETACRGGETE